MVEWICGRIIVVWEGNEGERWKGEWSLVVEGEERVRKRIREDTKRMESGKEWKEQCARIRREIETLKKH